MPQVIVKHGDDAEVALKIKNQLSEDCKDKFVIMRDDLSPVEIKALIGNFDYFIGTRMHSNIFATSMKVPTIAIAYEKKTNGIMHTVSLDDYILEMDKLTLKDLRKKVMLQKDNKLKIEKNLAKKINDIRKEIIEKLTVVLNGEK